jgi:hypothetical protein
MHGLETDIVFFSRIDREALQRLQMSNLEMARTSSPAPDTLYILERPPLATVLPRPGAGDLLAKVDGLWVFAPGGEALAGEDGVKTSLADDALMLPSGPVLFGSSGVGKNYLGAGWSKIEETGVWSDGPLAWLAFCTRGEPTRDVRLVFEARGFPPKPGGKQHVTVSAGDRPLTSFDLDLAAREIEVVVPADRIDQDGCFQLLFHIAEPKSPIALGVSTDDRALGVRLVSVKASDQ